MKLPVTAKLVAITLLFLFISAALPATASNTVPAPVEDKSNPFGLMTVFIYNGFPWIAGILADAAIYFKSLSKGKNFQTSATGLVLSFGGIWFTWVGIGGLQLFAFPLAALWAIAVAVCVLVLCVCKAIAYWVINEKFPPKRTMLLYLASGAIMTLAAFIVTKF